MINQAHFIFKNISSEDYLMVNKLPLITKAAKDIEKIEIEGRDGFLTIDKGSYKGTIKLVECTIMNLEQLDFICSWLDGSGNVIFSNEPDKTYKATIINQIEFEKIAWVFHTLLIQFDCQPHKYSLANEVIALQSAGTLYNSGTAISNPIIKVFGTGDVDLNINGNIVSLTSVDEYVTIDSDLIDCYKDTVLKNNDMNGEFPILEIGNNSISWIGTVSKIEITPNWRWI